MRWRCICGGVPHGFIFESDTGVCPRCKKSGPMSVAPLVDVHLLVPDESGPIFGAVRARVACQPRRDHLAAHGYDTFSATDEFQAVTCPSCKGTKAYQDMRAAAELSARAALAEAERIQALLSKDCCG